MSGFVIPSIFTAIDKLTAPVRAMAGAVSMFSNKADAAGARASRAFHRVGSSADRAYKAMSALKHINGALGFAGITIGAAGAVSFIGKFIKEASKIEDATASFQGLLGSVEKSRILISSLNKMGAETPFEFSDLTSAANLMISFGAATEKNVIAKLKIMGDLAQGNAEKLGGITLAYSQIEAAGKASMQDVNQLINNGVPILKALADQWGVNVGAAREMVSQGKATSTEVTKAFEAMTNKGGMFFNGMSIASQTFSGKMSTLTDTVNTAFAEIGLVVMPIVKEYVDKLTVAAEKAKGWAVANQELIKSKVTEWINNIKTAATFLYENIDKIILVTKVYVGTLVTLKAISLLSAVATWGMQGALLAYNIVLGLSTALQGKSALFLLGNTVAYGAFRAAVVAAGVATKVWTAIQWLFNVAMNANPIGLIITAIGLLVAAIVWVVGNTEGWGQTWDSILSWMGSIFDAFVSSIKLNWLVLSYGFIKMINTIVLAWKGGMNMMGKLSDEQYAKDKANIVAQEKLHLANIKKTGTEALEATQKMLAGPTISVRWTKDNESAPAKDISSTPALNPALTQQINQQSFFKNVVKETTSKMELTVKAPPGTVDITKNPSRIPIKVTPMLSWINGK